MADKIVAGAIGAGRIGRLHIKNIVNELPGVTLKTIADVNIEKLRAWAREVGISNLTANYRDILEDPEIDAVLIFSSTDTHAKFIQESAKAKKHVFCEKPIDFDIERIKETLEIVDKAGVKLMIGFNRRFDHNFSRARETVEQGDVGVPHIIKITSRDPAPPPIEYVKVSGGLFFDMTIHDWDMARFLADRKSTRLNSSHYS